MSTVGRPVTEPCGTVAAYKRAKRYKAKGEAHCGPCQDCTDAYNADHRRMYAKRKGLPQSK